METSLDLTTAVVTFCYMAKVVFPFALVWGLGAKTLRFLKNAMLGNDINI